MNKHDKVASKKKSDSQTKAQAHRVSQNNAQNAVGATVRALAQSKVTGTFYVWKLIFGRFLLRLSLIKPSQVMFMVKFGRTVLNFGL